MKRLLIPVGVVVVGVLAGAVISGVPTVVANDLSLAEIGSDPSTTASPSTTTPSTSTTAVTTTSPAVVPSVPDTPTATASDSSLDPAPREVALAVANAGAAPGTATDVAAELRAAGYASVLATDALVERATTVVLYDPGFEVEARQVAAELGVAEVEPRGIDPVARGDGSVDVWLIMGSDLP